MMRGPLAALLLLALPPGLIGCTTKSPELHVGSTYSVEASTDRECASAQVVVDQRKYQSTQPVPQAALASPRVSGQLRITKVTEEYVAAVLIAKGEQVNMIAAIDEDHPIFLDRGCNVG